MENKPIIATKVPTLDDNSTLIDLINQNGDVLWKSLSLETVH